MSIAWTALIGIIVGVIARLIAPGRKGPFGFLLTALLGVMGAFGTAYLGQAGGWFSVNDGAGLASAAFGAVFVLLLWGVLFKNQRRTSSI